VAIFGGMRKAKALQRLRDQKWRDQKEFQDLVGELQGLDLEVGDILWTLSAGSAAVRAVGAEVILKTPTVATARALYEESQGKHARAQQFILDMFRKLPDEATLPVLKEGLASDNVLEQRRAVDLLDQIPVEKTWGLLFDILERGAQDLRRGVLERLIKEPTIMQRPQVWERLRGLLQDPDEGIRARILDLMVAAKGKAQFELVYDRFCHDESAEIRERMMHHLTDWARGELAAKIQELVVPLLQEGDSDLRERAVRVMVCLPDVGACLREFIIGAQQAPGWIRERAMETLQDFEDSLIEGVVKLLADEETDVRIAAMQLASAFDDRRLVEPVLALMQDDDWWVRITAAAMLGRLADPRGIPPLLAALNNEDLRWTAIGSLAQIGDVRTLKPIIDCLSDPAPEVRLEVLNALERFADERTKPILETCAKTDKSLEVRERATQVLVSLSTAKEQASQALGDVAMMVEADRLDMLSKLLVTVRQSEGSDFHLKVGAPPMMRVHGRLEPILGYETVSPDLARELIHASLDERQRKTFEEELQLDFCYAIPNVGRYRANIYHDRLGVGGVFRVIPNRVPTFDELRIPSVVKRLTEFHQGLVILSGPASSGKTTTLAALVGLINNTKRDHILTLEDPIEFVHTHKLSLINQRQVNRHTQTFAAALRAALREDPDVIVVGEMRDTETLSLAMTAAGTGHLVIGTLHTTSAHKTVDRLIDAFPPGEQPQIRVAVSESLKAVVCQQLLPRRDGNGRVPAFEILFGTGPLSNMIREDKNIMIPSIMQTGRSLGMRTLDDSLKELVKEGLITGEVAYDRATSKEEFEQYLPDDVREALHAPDLEVSQ